ncbi:type 1 glutamine amidotransferase [Pseudoflavitalea sp. G-6-1-2]|uniref:type 1 glutamine amidotransferase n=1 Tax=Pseudoflavitalea sp. G-6-1-2 TaxID=2728841 RepID=UPI00146C0939|nr:type 1 glutamine amidotransferase [Pseudoflavitalea sp. G-6-1-2]NML20538.1 type 1 glutamine amidotransferase [Pseudoflavitalea sp. G-6-1-2]
MHIHFIQHVPFESPGFLLNWAASKQHSTGFTKLYEEAVFPSPQSLDWLVVMGGPMGVHDEAEFSWLAAEKTFIRECIDAGKKVLGICLGSQLIADVLGARVYRNPEKEIGWMPVSVLHPEHPLTQGFPSSVTVFHWHGDTFELPSNAIRLFETAACANQGYVIGNNFAALQFHMEVDAPLAQQMLQHGREELTDAPFIQSEATILHLTETHAAATQAYFAKFLDAFEMI